MKLEEEEDKMLCMSFHRINIVTSWSFWYYLVELWIQVPPRTMRIPGTVAFN
jgi:hypothetical protein